MSEWKEKKFGEMVDVVNGFAFKSANFLDGMAINSFPVIKIKNVANGNVHLNGAQYHQYSESLSKYLVEKGDVLVALTGNHPQAETQVVGLTSRYTIDRKALLNQRVAKIISKNDECLSADFIYYFLKDTNTHQYLASQSSGSANQANISKSDIENIPFSQPPKNEQKAIAAVLSSLDDKIDLLHRQNKTLEAMAATLFRQWFVEEAQENWEEKSLLDVIELVGGGTPKTSVAEYWDGEIPWLSGGDIAASHKSFVVDSEKTITQEGIENSSAKLLPRFATVISARGTVGKYAMLSKPMAYSQSNYGVLPKVDGCFFFTYLLINHAVSELCSSAYGSVFDTITTTTFRDIVITVPSHEAIQDFEKMVSAYFTKKLHVLTQIQTLEKLRDNLLPKLMCGEVRVSHA